MIERYLSWGIYDIWNPEGTYEAWLDVELAALNTLLKSKQLEPITKRPGVDEEAIAGQELKYKHDMVAFLATIRPQLPEYAREWLHWGLTSSDIKDTALYRQIFKSGEHVMDLLLDLHKNLGAYIKGLDKFRLMGRTHGQPAEVINLGKKYGMWARAIVPSLANLEYLLVTNFTVGKLSGPVGDNKAFSEELERDALGSLEMRPSGTQSQVLPRWPIASLMSELAILASNIEKACTDIRNLSRPEIGEMREGFTKSQVGSSAMPHKHNPIKCEQLCGLARLMRSYVQPAMENIVLWDERDMTHSSVERVILPDAFHIICYMITTFINILDELEIDTVKMEENIAKFSAQLNSSTELNNRIVAGEKREDSFNDLQSKF